MSQGLTLKELVRQVYYMQEKVLLDFIPSDDKFQEVLQEANFVIQELQKEEEWSWLRTEYDIGYTVIGVRDYDLPADCYKPCMLFGDKVRLMNEDYRPVAEVPYVSNGQPTHHVLKQTSRALTPSVPYCDLGVTLIGEKLRFTRPLAPHELNRLIVLDGIKRMPLIDIDAVVADYEAQGHIWDTQAYFTDVPDPMYIVARTAALHAQGSPLAQGRLVDLNDLSQKLLSAMRQNDAGATAPDYIDYGDLDTYMIL